MDVASHRNNLVDDLKRLAAEAMDRADRSRRSSKNFDVDGHLTNAKKEAKKLRFPGGAENRRLRGPEEIAKVPTPAAEPQRSFFDEVA